MNCVDRDSAVLNWAEGNYNEKVDIIALRRQVSENIEINKEYGFHLGLGMGYVYDVMIDNYLYTKSSHDAFNLLLLARYIMAECYDPERFKTNENYSLKLDHDRFINILKKRGAI